MPAPKLPPMRTVNLGTAAVATADAISVDLGATNPNDGDTITFTVALPVASAERVA